MIVLDFATARDILFNPANPHHGLFWSGKDRDLERAVRRAFENNYDTRPRSNASAGSGDFISEGRPHGGTRPGGTGV
jgi:hypothetical protein